MFTSIIALTCIYNSTLLISRPGNAIGEEAFICSSENVEQPTSTCTWPTEWKRILLTDVNNTSMFVAENITGIHFAKIVYVLKERRYGESQWIQIKQEDEMKECSANALYVTVIIMLATIFITLVLGIIMYNKRVR